MPHFKHCLGKLILVLGLSILAGMAKAADAPGSADPPGLKRFDGASILFQSKADYDAFKLALEKVEWSGAEAKVKPFRSLPVEGRRITTYYRLPAQVGVLEALRNYEQELRDAGYEILHSGIGEAIETVSYNNQIAREVYGMRGTYGTPEEKVQWPFQHTDEAKAGYFTARSTGADGRERYVSGYFVVNTHDRWLDLPVDTTLARIDLIESKPRTQRMVLVKSAEMAESIGRNGRIALYGIEFAHDSAEVQASADALLQEIAKLMREQPALSVLVVGHTDTSGSFDYNRGLSQRRAEAVVAKLAGLGVARARLFPVGVGFAAPLASNLDEEGRARNRRVELVDLAGGKLP